MAWCAPFTLAYDLAPVHADQLRYLDSSVVCLVQHRLGVGEHSVCVACGRVFLLDDA